MSAAYISISNHANNRVHQLAEVIAASHGSATSFLEGSVTDNALQEDNQLAVGRRGVAFERPAANSGQCAAGNRGLEHIK